MALINELRNMGDAVRERAGLTELMTIEQMADAVRAIPQPVVEDIKITKNGTYVPPTGIDGFGSVEVEVQGTVEVEPIVLSGTQSNGCASAMSRNYIKLFGDTVSTKDLKTANNMFQYYEDESIPFELNFAKDTTGGYSIASLFSYAYNLKTLPKITGDVCANDITSLFLYCQSLREVPDDYFDAFDFSPINNSAYSFYGKNGGLYENCRSLRKPNMKALKAYNPLASYPSQPYYGAFNNCYVLDEVRDLVVVKTATPMTSNMFISTFNYCYRLKSMTFETNEDGSPIETQWKNQTIELHNGVGFNSYKAYYTGYNSGITEDKAVGDDATYAALKNDADWFATDIFYSRYNHDSAVETINSLPDTSAYLATAGGTNTIKFRAGDCGSKTDGGAIKNLTEAEIAVAAAKGWTISYV